MPTILFIALFEAGKILVFFQIPLCTMGFRFNGSDASRYFIHDFVTYKYFVNVQRLLKLTLLRYYERFSYNLTNFVYATIFFISIVESRAKKIYIKYLNVQWTNERCSANNDFEPSNNKLLFKLFMCKC